MMIMSRVGEGSSALMFSQILHDNDDVEKEFEVSLGTKEELLMLQLCSASS